MSNGRRFKRGFDTLWVNHARHSEDHLKICDWNAHTNPKVALPYTWNVVESIKIGRFAIYPSILEDFIERGLAFNRLAGLARRRNNVMTFKPQGSSGVGRTYMVHSTI